MIIVTGGTGFTGSAVVRELASRGRPVAVLSRDASGAVIVSKRIVASVGSVPAASQPDEPAAPASPIETVDVSGSRINLAGFQSPTPVTIIGLGILYLVLTRAHTKSDAPHADAIPKQ